MRVYDNSFTSYPSVEGKKWNRVKENIQDAISPR
jgi:hypothetical protein